jgi:hypothetical protein
MKNKFWRLLRWVLILSASYWLLTTLYFGYDNIDDKKGIYTFYWSGLNALFIKDKDFGIQRNKEVETKLDGLDGPYIIGNKCYSIDEHNNVKESTVVPAQTVSVNVSGTAIHNFSVKLKTAYKDEEYLYAMPKKLIAISDIEGNFTGFYSFLLANKVIDKECNWIFGSGHLVLNGDFVDRGDQVAQVLWLIYKLEQQAEEAGGKVHYILGNHEIMMMQGNASYADFKYITVAKQISNNSSWESATKFLYSPQSELGRWLRTKNIIERIGTTIFVHAGLNIQHAAAKMDMKTFNQIARKHYGVSLRKKYQDPKEQLTLNSITGPYWDRSLAMDLKNKLLYAVNRINVKATTQAELNNILAFYQASRVVIGHSVVGDIQTDYQGKVIKIDLKHGQIMNSGLTKGILFEQKQVFKLDDKGYKAIL